MAKITIHSIIDDYIYIEYDKANSDYFEYIHNTSNKKEQYKIKKITIQYFINTFLQDNNNFYIDSIKTNKIEDDIIKIDILYKYIEFNDGNHIYTNITNSFYVDKYKYKNSILEKIIEKETESLSLINESKREFFNSYDNNINDINKRIEPGSLNFVIDFLNNNEKVIDFEKYNINKDEFLDYININKKYINKYVRDNWDNLQKLYKVNGAILVIALFFIILSYFSNNTNSIINYSSQIAFVYSITSYLLSFPYVEAKISSMKRIRTNNELKEN